MRKFGRERAVSSCLLFGVLFQTDFVNFELQGLGSQEFYQCGIDLSMHNTVVNDSDLSAQLDYLHFGFHQDDFLLFS